MMVWSERLSAHTEPLKAVAQSINYAILSWSLDKGLKMGFIFRLQNPLLSDSFKSPSWLSKLSLHTINSKKLYAHFALSLSPPAYLLLLLSTKPLPTPRSKVAPLPWLTSKPSGVVHANLFHRSSNSYQIMRIVLASHFIKLTSMTRRRLARRPRLEPWVLPIIWKSWMSHTVCIYELDAHLCAIQRWCKDCQFSGCWPGGTQGQNFGICQRLLSTTLTRTLTRQNLVSQALSLV